MCFKNNIVVEGYLIQLSKYDIGFTTYYQYIWAYQVYLQTINRRQLSFNKYILLVMTKEGYN